MADADLLGPLHGQGVERAVPHEPRQGADRSLDRLRLAHSNRLRPRLADGVGRSRKGRRSGRTRGPHAHSARWHSARSDEHVDDHQRDRRVAARAVRGQRRRSRCSARRVARNHAERHRQGIPVARHVHLPADSVASSHRRHGRVVRQQHAQVESHERLLVPPPRGRSDSRSGDRVLVGHSRRSSRRRARLRPGSSRAVRSGLRIHLVLRERRHSLRGRDLQDARVH